MAKEPDPQVQVFLDMINDVDSPSMAEVDVDVARQQFRRLSTTSTGEDVHNVKDRTIDGRSGEVDIRVYQSGTEPDPIVVFFHGGGFVLGDLDTHDNVCRALTNAAEATVVSVHYRRAPEHPFPAALEDAYAATEWAADADLGNGTLTVAGDSAGGNLAAAVALRARDHDGPDLDRQLLVYPFVGSPFGEFESYEENGEGYFIETDGITWSREQYVQRDVNTRNPYAFPLLASDLSGLPPATVVTAGFDPLRDEGNQYAERLADAGVPVDHKEYGAMIHGFLNMLDLVDVSSNAVDLLADGVRAADERRNKSTQNTPERTIG